MPNVTQLVRGKTGTQTQALRGQSPQVYHLGLLQKTKTLMLLRKESETLIFP